MKKLFTLTICLFALLTVSAQSINNLYVSPTGYAMWEGNPTYEIYLNNEIVAEDLATDYYQHEDLVDGQEYVTKVVAANGSSAEYTWTKVACDEFEGVTNLSANVFDGKAVIKWTLPTLDNGRNTREGAWLYYDNGTYSSSLCITFDKETSEPFKWGIMFPASDIAQLAGQAISKVSLYDSEQFDGEVFIYKGGNDQPGTLAHSQKFTTSGSNDFYEIALNKTVEISGSENIWVVMTHYGGWQPASNCDDQGDPNGRWFYYEGYAGYFSESGWLDNAMIAMPAKTWMIRAYASEIEKEPVPTEVIGAMLYRNGELLTEEPADKETFIDPNGKDGDEYTVRVVYGGEIDSVHYAMSCPQSVIFSTTSVDENNIDKVAIYPNPTNGELNINVEGMRHISIVNALGQIVYNNNVKSCNKTINMSKYNTGIYMIHITTENGVIVRQVSVVE